MYKHAALKNTPPPHIVSPLPLLFILAITACGNAASPDTITIPEAADMVWLPSGSFRMGSENGLPNEQPVHSVTLSPFYIGKYEVTQARYQAVMGNNPSLFTSDEAAGEIQGRRPVERVSWYDALVFCNTLSISEGVTPAYRIDGKTNPAQWGSVPSIADAAWDAAECNMNADGYRLPTEAEWEYAARGGHRSKGYSYAGSNTLDAAAWYGGNSGIITHETGKKTPNEAGLYDMNGNVAEWCWDWSGRYTGARQTDPAGASSGSRRVYRGGTIRNPEGIVRFAYRPSDLPSNADSGVGFRLVRSFRL